MGIVHLVIGRGRMEFRPACDRVVGVCDVTAGRKDSVVPDKRCHRGRHPQDDLLFAETQWPSLREAVADLSLLLTKGYAERSALKLVGDRFGLTERQRIAVMRCACSDKAVERRRAAEVGTDDVARGRLSIDGYNVLTTVEAALAGGVLIEGRDGCVRDMASMHGTFRQVKETGPAIELLGQALCAVKAGRCLLLLDSPVSNSGRLRKRMQETASANGWDWEIDLVNNPDAVLAESEDIIATADSVILDRCGRWFNLSRFVLAFLLPAARVISLGRAL